MEKYPEHAKLKAVQNVSQKIHEFVFWLQDEHGICLAHEEDEDFESETEDTLIPTSKNITDLVADFLEIDLKKLEDEKLALISEARRCKSEGCKNDKTHSTKLKGDYCKQCEDVVALFYSGKHIPVTTENLKLFSNVVDQLTHAGEFSNKVRWGEFAQDAFALLPSYEGEDYPKEIMTPLARACSFLEGDALDEIFLALVRLSVERALERGACDSISQGTASIAGILQLRVSAECLATIRHEMLRIKGTRVPEALARLCRACV